MATKRNSVKWWNEALGVKSKSEAEGRIRAIVASNPDGQALNAIDQNTILTVLKHHYQYTAKVGCGVKHIEVRTNIDEFMPTRGFWIVRTDGTAIDISWPIAMMPEGKPSPQHHVGNAARFEIKSQIDAEHRNGLCVQCPLCNLPMQRGVNLNVDHELPFKQLLADFLHSKSLNYTDVDVEDLGLNGRLKDRQLAVDWQNYHRANAVLRLTHKRCNLSRKAA